MFRNTFQSGFLSILYSIGSKPLQIWDKQGACGMLYACSRCRALCDDGSPSTTPATRDYAQLQQITHTYSCASAAPAACCGELLPAKCPHTQGIGCQHRLLFYARKPDLIMSYGSRTT